jgi:hypothetical protein
MVQPHKVAGNPTNGQRRIVATYDYTDERGVLLYQVVRYDLKDFRQRRPNGNGGWLWNLEGVRRVLYRLSELLAADPGRPVFILEGEKDVDQLARLEIVATTNAQGAGKWRPEYSEALRGRHIIILPDNDTPGRSHAAAVAASLEGVAASVRILELPGLPPKGDVSDWLAAGGTKEELLTLAQRGDAWEPPPDEHKTSPTGEYQGDPKPWEPPIPLGEVPAADAFTVSVLPRALVAFVEDVARARHCPLDYVTVPLLTIAGGAIGNSRALEIKPGWREHPCLYGAGCVVKPRTTRRNLYSRSVTQQPARHRGWSLGPIYIGLSEAYNRCIACARGR